MVGFIVRPFVPAPDDPYVAEHALVSQWTAEALESLGPNGHYHDLDLKQTPAGRHLT